MCTQACTHASVHAHYFFAGLGPYLSLFGSDWKDRDIYGIVGTFPSWLRYQSTCMGACTLSSVHAHYFLACLGQYISQIGWDQRDQSLYRIRRTCPTCLSTVSPEHASLCASMLCACVLRTISQPNWVWSERSKYLRNQENMPDLSEHKIWPEDTS